MDFSGKRFFFLLLPAIGAVILVSIYITLPILLARTVQTKLEGLGCQSVVVVIGYPTLNRMRVKTLQGTLAAHDLKFTLRNIDLYYSPKSLVAGWVESSVIQEAVFFLPVEGALRQFSSKRIDQVDSPTTPSGLLRSFPVGKLLIEHFSIKTTPRKDEKAASIDIRGSLEKSRDGRISLNGHGNADLLALLPFFSLGQAPFITLRKGNAFFDAVWSVEFFPEKHQTWGTLLNALSLTASVTAQVDSLNLAVSGINIPLDNMTGTLHLSIKLPEGTFHGTIEKESKLRTQINMDYFDSGPTLVTAREPIDVSYSARDKRWRLSLTSLSLNLPAIRHYNFALGTESVLLTDLSAEGKPAHLFTTGKFSISGASATLVNTTIPPFQAEGSFDVAPHELGVKLTGARIAAPLPIKSFALELRSMNYRDALSSKVQIKHLSAHVLGGRLLVNDLQLKLTDKSFTLPVRIDGIKLKEVLELHPQQHLRGTGIIDGLIPITVNPAGIRVNGGTVEARPPGGVLKMTTGLDDSASTSEYLKLVTEALENFHYDSLKGNVNYDEGGNLRLKVSVNGRNPDLKPSQPIHFNFAIEENIPALLKSLQITRDLTAKIEGEIKRKLGDER